MKIRRFFGLSVETRCDRCHIKIISPSGVYTLCKDCFLINPHQLRQHDVKLDYQRMIEGSTCVLCKVKVISEQNHCCNNCVYQHADKTHSGWYINSDYQEDTKLYRSCLCGDMFVVTIGRTQQTNKFDYNKVGKRQPVSIPYQCSRNIKSCGNCEHDWLILANNETPYDAGMKKYLDYKQNPAMGLLLDFEDDFEYMAFGSTKFWCSRCGLYHDLSPSKVK